jgi:aldehyde dehydrogenase
LGIRFSKQEETMNKPEFLVSHVSPFKTRYDNFINGEWRAPVHGKYFDNISPINGARICEVPRSDEDDIERALDAAHAAKDAWGRTSPAARANILNAIAQRMEDNLATLALAETWDNGKPIRETTAADIPLAIDHFRYFAGCVRAQEGSIAEIDQDTVAYHFHEPLGVVGQIIPWNFPLLMAAWKLAPALAAGNCVVLKPAEQTPASILVWAGLVADLLPPGVLNIVNGFGVEAGKPLASSPRIAKIAFTGETTTGRLIMQYASQNLIPVTLELGGKSPNIFFADVVAEDDAYLDKAIEGFVMFALNQGEVCTCPSRALIQEPIYDRFMERALARVAAIKQGSPLNHGTMIGAQASSEQMAKILSYIDIGKQEGANLLAGGERNVLPGELAGSYYVKPTVFHGHNRMRIFQEEIFGPVLAVTTFKTADEALQIANDGVLPFDGVRARLLHGAGQGGGLQAHPGLLPDPCWLRRRPRRHDRRAWRLRPADRVRRSQRPYRPVDQLLHPAVRAGERRASLDARLDPPDGARRCGSRARETPAAAGNAGDSHAGACRCAVGRRVDRLAARGQGVLGDRRPRHCAAKSLALDPGALAVLRDMAGVVGGGRQAAVGRLSVHDGSAVLACGAARHLGRGAAHFLFLHGAHLRRTAVDHGCDLVADDPRRRHRLCGAKSEHSCSSPSRSCAVSVAATSPPRWRTSRSSSRAPRRATRSRSTPGWAISASASCNSWCRSRSPQACSAGSAAIPPW